MRTTKTPATGEGDLILPVVDFLAIFIIIGAAALVAFVLPTASGMIVGAIALLACGLYAVMSSNRRGQRIEKK